MPSPALATATDLAQWAVTRDAQGELPHFVRSLVQATAANVTRLEFRTAEGVQLGGWDGLTEVGDAHPYVPGGSAGWELGTELRSKAKADSDFDARAAAPADLDPANSTFVFATLRRWRDGDKWAAERKKAGPFRDVRVIDADSLHGWLEMAPAVHLDLSARLGKPIESAEPLISFWNRWARGTAPRMSPGLVLAGREQSADGLLAKLAGSAGATVVRGDSRDEAIAFVCAALHRLDEMLRDSAWARSVVVTAPTAFRIMSGTTCSLILVAVGIEPGDIAAAIEAGHQVIVPMGPEGAVRGDVIELGRIRREPAKAALVGMGRTEKQADEEATVARRSLLSMRRLLAISPGTEEPAWLGSAAVSAMVPAMLAGAWDAAIGGDREVIEGLANGPYEDVERSLVLLARAADPPIRQIGSKWLLVSREDAWSLLSARVTNTDLQRLEAVAAAVLGTPNPALDLDPGERWMANVRDKARPHSGDVRGGLAETIAQLGGQSGRLKLGSPRSGQSVADGIVHHLLAAANGDRSARLWLSVADVLPALAEAAPEVFLDAVDDGTRGPEPVLAALFEDQDAPGLGFGSSAHTHLLWALEGLAWSPALLGRVTVLLGRLARIDPGGRLSNRPPATLRSIFLTWHPQTAAALPDKLAAIDTVRGHEPGVAWQLMIDLLPRNGDIGMDNHEPAWRDWKPDDDEHVSVAELVEAAAALVDRLISDAGVDAGRWAGLVSAADRLPRPQLENVISALEGLDANAFSDAERENIRVSLRDTIAQHRLGAGQPWALPAAEVDRLLRDYDRFAPDDVVLRMRWLFGHHVRLLDGERDDWRKEQAAVARERSTAVEAMWAEGGLATIRRAVAEVADPFALGFALGSLPEVDDADNLLGSVADEDARVKNLARGYVVGLASRIGGDWMLRTFGELRGSWTPAQQGAFLTLAQPRPEIWSLVEPDEQVAAAYWSRLGEYMVDANVDGLQAARRFLDHGRPLAAVNLLAHHKIELITDEASSDLAIKALEAAAAIPIEGGNDRAMRPYYVAQILHRIDELGFGSQPSVARIEWIYLPLLEDTDRQPRGLHQALAESPDFFAEVLGWVFKPRSAPPRETAPDDEVVRGRLGYALLESWRTAPGTRDDGSIDASTLNAWVDAARSRVQAEDRAGVGDDRIGHVLSFAAPDPDGLWPPLPVRDLIERIESDSLDLGIAIGVTNQRGASFRGLTDGGTQEREAAAPYRETADRVANRWPRTARLLRRIADSFEREGEHWDIEASYTEDTWH